MRRLFILLAAIYYLGDPGLTMLTQLNEVREYLVVSVLTFIAAPWVVAHFDN
jgi:hypothetical protein